MRKSNWLGILFLSLFTTVFSISAQANLMCRTAVVAGNGKTGLSGDGGPAINARLNLPVQKGSTVVPLKKGTTTTPVLQDSTLSR